MKEITKRQREVLTVIEQFCQEHGYSPSMRELASTLGIQSTSAIFKHIHSLSQKGFLTHQKKSARSIQPTKQNNELENNSISVPIIGSITKGQKLEFFTTEEQIAFPLHLFKKELPSYAFIIRDKSFENEMLCEGDIVAVQAKSDIEAQDKVLAMDATNGITIFKGKTHTEKPLAAQILGVIVAMLRPYQR